MTLTDDGKKLVANVCAAMEAMVKEDDHHCYPIDYLAHANVSGKGLYGEAAGTDRFDVTLRLRVRRRTWFSRLLIWRSR